MRGRPLVVLVVGVSEDSGKTLLAASLVSALRGEGVRAAPFKPYGATELWRHPGILGEIARRRLVVTRDALIHARVSGLPLELVNPAALIVGVEDASRRGWRPLHAGPPLPRLGVLARLSVCREERVDTLHLVNIEALERLPRGLQGPVVDAAAALSPHPLRAGDEMIDRLVRGGFHAEVESCLGRLSREAEVIVIESNSDVPLPSPSAYAADLVLVAAPGVAGVVEGGRYRKSLEALGVVRGGIASVSEVVGLAGVARSVELPLLEEGELYRPADLGPILDEVLSLLDRPPKAGESD